MTANKFVLSDVGGPFGTRPVDTWNSICASLPSLQNFLQVSVDTSKVDSAGLANLYDRKALKFWTSASALTGSLGPTLLALQSGGRYVLQWPGTSAFNYLASPTGVQLPAVGTIILVVDLDDYDVASTFFESATTTGNYVKIGINASGEVEAIGASGATLAKTADLTPYTGPMLIMFSWSGSACKISVNGTVGATTSGAYIPNADALKLGSGLDDGSRLYAAAILGADYHATAYDVERSAFVIESGRAFGLAFTIDWDFPDLGSSKLYLNLDPADLADGDVAAWTDRANGTAFTEATNSPSKASADFNGHASVTFDHTNSEKIRDLTLDATVPSGTAESGIFILVDQTTDETETTDMAIISYGASGSGGARNIRRISDGTLNKVRASTNNTGSFVDATIDFTGKHVVEALWKDGVEYLYVDGTFVGQITTAFNTNAGGRFAIGCSSSSFGTPVGFWSGKVALVVGAKGYTQADRDLITGRMAFHGGIQSLLPDGSPYKRATFV